MMVTIGLVIIVIFAFLRTLWATVIPSLAVPLSLLATFGVMYAVGYSLDNISLMALTISVGVVIDDAIRMIQHHVLFRVQTDGGLANAKPDRSTSALTFTQITNAIHSPFTPPLS